MSKTASLLRDHQRQLSDASPQPLRVVWDMHLAGRNQTGTGVYAARLLEHLQREPQIEVMPLEGWRFLDQRRWLPWRLARAFADAVWTQTALTTELARLRADVLHAPAHVAPLRGVCPLVVTVHDTMYHRFPNQYARWWVKYMEWLMPQVLRRAAAVIAVSEHTKLDIVRDYGVESSRVQVIYHGVDHERFCPSAATGAERVLAHYGIQGEYVLHVGALVTRKNIPLLLEAVALLKARGCWGKRQVVLAGSGSPGMRGAEEIYEAVARLSLADDVVFAGHVPDAWLPALYAQASSLAFPSLYEGFGLPLVEAMACGIPVVAMAGSSVSEVVGEAGILVPAGDREAFATSLRLVLEDTDLQAELRQRGLQRAASFTWERAARQTVEVYCDIVSQKGEQRR